MPNKKKSKTGLLALAAKLGSKLLSFSLKAFKLTKIGLVAASFAGYAILFNWKFAILILIAVGWHEQGHVWAMRRMHIKTKGWYMIPFIGGAAIAEEEYKTYGQNAYIAIMGPIWGMLMAFSAAGLYWITGNPLWAASGAWMATLNLFNLLPITPLDGGQMIGTIAFSLHKNVGVIFMALSMVLCGLVLYFLHAGLFVLILAVGALELYMEVRRRIKLHQYESGLIPKWKLPKSLFKDDKLKSYPVAMNKKQLALTALAYLVTIAGLFGLLFLLKHVPGADLAANFFE